MFSSATNFALAVLVARNLTVEGFGAFGLAFALYRFVLGTSTAMWTLPVTITHAGAPPPDRRERVTRSAGAALVSGLVVAPVVAGVGVILGGVTGSAFLALSVCLPGLLLQDAWRQGFVAIGEPRSAALNDLCWGLLQLAGGFGVVTLMEQPAVFPLVLVWGLSGVGASALGCLQARALPKIAGTRELWRAHSRLGPRFVGEFIVSSGQGQLTLLFLAAYVGVAASAGYRGAQVVYGPQRLVTNGLALGLLPEAVRVRSRRSRLRTIVVVLSALSVVVVACTMVLLLWLPDSIGSQLLGQTWDEAQPIVLPMGLYGIAGAIASGPSVGLRAIGDAAACLRNQVVASVAALVATVVGVLIDGALGAAWGLAAAGAVSAVVWTVSWRGAVTRFAIDGQPMLVTGVEDVAER